MKTTATEFKTHLGIYLQGAIKEPVFVEKNNRPVAVLLSIEEYERLIALEDKYWEQRADAAAKEGFIGKAESMNLIRGIHRADD